ncbi:hypothetical protein HYX12_01665, partial [Candidatus Woesearchaeota archaeon]|nr:hypothetical protein [Candidatus Woesearchaeota archaeon]
MGKRKNFAAEATRRRDAGTLDLEQLAEDWGLKLPTAKAYLSSEGFYRSQVNETPTGASSRVLGPFRDKRDAISKEKAERLEKIKSELQRLAAIDQLPLNYTLFARERKIGISTLKRIAKGVGIELESSTKDANRINIFHKTVKEGVDSVQEYCQRLSFQPSSLYHFLRDNGLTLPPGLRPYRYRPEIDSLVDDGKNLSQIADLIGETRENIRQYLLYSGQHDQWKENKKDRNINKRTEQLERQSVLEI